MTEPATDATVIPSADGAPADPNRTFSQAELEQIVQNRLTRERRKFEGEAADLRLRAEQYDELVAATQTEQERVVEEALERGRAEAAWSLAPKLLEAHFVSALAGRVDVQRVREIVAPLNPEHFFTDDGEVDEEAVTAYAERIAPAAGGTGRGPDLGQGARGRQSRVTGKEQGLAEARRRFGAKQTSTTSTT